jgi:nicotinamidase-related amidase
MDAFEDHCWKDVISPEIFEVYKPYRRETYVGKRPVLMAIDLYNLVFEGGPHPVHELVKKHKSTCGVHAYEAIGPIQELLASARRHRLPIIYTTTETRKESNPDDVRATNLPIKDFDKSSYEIREELKPLSGDLIIYKERASAFFGTPLIAHLTRLQADSLIVCGESTSGCVRASVVDAYSYGIHPVVVEECCFDRSLISHKINLFDLHHKYADVMHLDEVKRRLNEID